MSVELRGVEELKKGLKKMATMDDVKQAIRVNTTEMHQKASRKVRVDSGHLKRSLTIEFLDNGLTGRVYTDVEYGMYVEYGTGIYATGGHGRKTPWVYYNAKLGRFVQTKGMSPRPFMRPSFYEQRPKFKKDMGRLLKE